MRYGLPYKGSKNGIAKWLVDELPKAEIFVDLFFGGGAVTHRAMISRKYKQFIVNDIDARLPKLFVGCGNGKYTV
jgi:site-specific DNA-adenine methylase